MKKTLTKIATLGLIGLGLIGYSRPIVRAEQEVSEQQKLESTIQKEDPEFAILKEKANTYNKLENPEEIKKAYEGIIHALDKYIGAEFFYAFPESYLNNGVRKSTGTLKNKK